MIRVVEASLGSLGIVVGVSWAFVALVRLPDARGLNHVSGAWMALAAHAAQGTIYDGVRYGGTRYMPLFFLLHGSLARVTGEFVVSGRVVALAGGLGLLTALVLIMRHIGCRLPIAIGLAAFVPLSAVGLAATTTIRGDVLAVALQVGAIGIAARRDDTKGVAGAGVLCVLALFTKTSALWGALAIAAWLLLQKDRRRSKVFLGTYVAGVLLAVAVLQVMSDGRFLNNLVELTFAGEGGPSQIGRAAGETLGFLRAFAPVTWALIGLGFASVLLAFQDGRLGLHHLAFLFAGLITLPVMAGATGQNHLLDIVALTPLLVADLWVRAAPRVGPGPSTRLIVGVMALWIGTSTYLLDLRPEVARAARVAVGAEEPLTVGALREQLRPAERILSEHPGIPVMMGQLPVVGDPWVLLRLGDRHPRWRQDLVNRIQEQEFDAVLLLYDIENPDEETRGFYEGAHLGPQLIDAIRGSYCLTGTVDGLDLYRRIASGACPTQSRHA
jgi:hypothetical protein